MAIVHNQKQRRRGEQRPFEVLERMEKRWGKRNKQPRDPNTSRSGPGGPERRSRAALRRRRDDHAKRQAHKHYRGLRKVKRQMPPKKRDDVNAMA